MYRGERRDRCVCRVNVVRGLVFVLSVGDRDERDTLSDV